MNTTLATETPATDGLTGWTWTGRITDAGNALENSCGHCGTPIRYLVHVVHDDGRTMHVGTSCAEVVGLSAKAIRAIRREQRDLARDARYADDRAEAQAANEAEFGEQLAAARAAVDATPADDVPWFVFDILDKAKRYRLSLAQVDALNRAVDAMLNPAAPSVHLGTVGQRLTVTGTVRALIDLEPYQYGAAVPFLVVLDVDGNDVVTKTTAAWRYGLTRGERIELVGTVKDHGEYRGSAQTVLTRCKRLDEPAASPAAPVAAPAPCCADSAPDCGCDPF